MNSLPRLPIGPIGPLAVAVCALALARPAGAVYDCCFANSLPPMLTAFHLPAASADEGLATAARLGFRSGIDNFGMARAALDRGYLAWCDERIAGGYGGIPTGSGHPLVCGVFYLICRPGPVPDRPTGSDPGAWHPNGALQVSGALAVVSDLDASCAGIASSIPADPRWRLAFGPPRAVPALGALARTGSTSDGTTLTVLARDPGLPDGRVARWLGGAGPRWLGVAVSVEDLDRTASLLTGNGVACERLEIDGLPLLLVELGGAAGAVVVFHPAAAAPFAGRSRLP